MILNSWRDWACSGGSCVEVDEFLPLAVAHGPWKAARLTSSEHGRVASHLDEVTLQLGERALAGEFEPAVKGLARRIDDSAEDMPLLLHPLEDGPHLVAAQDVGFDNQVAMVLDVCHAPGGGARMKRVRTGEVTPVASVVQPRPLRAKAPAMPLTASVVDITAEPDDIVIVEQQQQCLGMGIDRDRVHLGGARRLNRLIVPRVLSKDLVDPGLVNDRCRCENRARLVSRRVTRCRHLGAAAKQHVDTGQLHRARAVEALQHGLVRASQELAVARVGRSGVQVLARTTDEVRLCIEDFNPQRLKGLTKIAHERRNVHGSGRPVGFVVDQRLKSRSTVQLVAEDAHRTDQPALFHAGHSARADVAQKTTDLVTLEEDRTRRVVLRRPAPLRLTSMCGSCRLKTSQRLLGVCRKVEVFDVVAAFSSGWRVARYVICLHSPDSANLEESWANAYSLSL